MEVKALKTFHNSHTGTMTRAGDTFEAEDGYAGDLQKQGFVEPAGLGTSASRTGAVPQPQKTAAMSGAPMFTGSKSVGGVEPPSSSSRAAPASPPRTVVTPAAPTKR